MVCGTCLTRRFSRDQTVVDRRKLKKKEETKEKKKGRGERRITQGQRENLGKGEKEESQKKKKKDGGGSKSRQQNLLETHGIEKIDSWPEGRGLLWALTATNI